MKKYDLLITLIIGANVNNLMNYSEYDGNATASITLDSFIKDYSGFHLVISKSGKKYMAFVDGVEDSDFEQAELKELMGLIKEKFEAKQELTKINAWKKLGLSRRKQ